MNIRKFLGITATTLAFSTLVFYSFNRTQDVKASSELSLVGKNQRYMYYEFIITKSVKATHLKWASNPANNKTYGNFILHRGMKVYAMYHDMGGEAWRIKIPHLKTPKDVTITAVLTNANAKPVKGNYKKIHDKAMKELN